MSFSKYKSLESETHESALVIDDAGFAAQRARARDQESISAAPEYLDDLSPSTPQWMGELDVAVQRKRRWWLWTGILALLFGALAVGALFILIKSKNTVDQLVILTVPSGAEIKLTSKSGPRNYGLSPIKLEQVEVGTYTLTITKEGFEPIEQQITVSRLEQQQLDFKLKPLLPTDVSGLPVEERLKEYRQWAEDAFARGFNGPPWEKSSLYYVDSILSVDQGNEYALDFRERIRKSLLQSAQSSIIRGDSARAQEIYRFVLEYFPGDEDARGAQGRLESQLSERRGEVRDLVKKADEALNSGNLTDPPRASAYYFSKQALAIDRQNTQALAISNRVKAKLFGDSEQLAGRGDLAGAVRQLQKAVQYFPEEKQFQARLREMENSLNQEAARATDAQARRLDGLQKYRSGNYTDAQPDLEYALTNGKATPDVVFALADVHLKLGHLDQAAAYFVQVPSSSDHYTSSIAALGDVAYRRGDVSRAVQRYRQAIQLGGSIRYSIPELEDRIEKIEKKERERAAEPEPVTIRVKHSHRFGSCSGLLRVDATGVSYSGDHGFSANLVGVSVRATMKERSNSQLRVQYRDGSIEFQATTSDAERFRDAVSKYQVAIGK
jgi:tetratricopeptide (TPR) repeat protein